MVRSLFTHFKQSCVGTTNKRLVVLPLHMVWTFLKDIPTLYIGLGQKLTFQGRFLPAAECCLADPSKVAADAISYSVTNAFLVQAYSILDAPRKSEILKTVVAPLPIAQNITYVTGAA